MMDPGLLTIEVMFFNFILVLFSVDMPKSDEAFDECEESRGDIDGQPTCS